MVGKLLPRALEKSHFCPNSTYSICCGFVVDLLYNFSICCGLVVDFMGLGVTWPKIKSKMADSDDEDELLVTFAVTSVAVDAGTFMLDAAQQQHDNENEDTECGWTSICKDGHSTGHTIVWWLICWS